MMAGWLLYTLLTTLVLLAAGSAGERMTRLLRAPSRFLWVTMILAAVTLSAMSLADRTMPQPEPTVTAPRHINEPRPERSTPAPSVLFTVARTHAPSGRGPSLRAASVFITRLRHVAELRIDATRWKRFDAPFAAVCVAMAAIGLLIVAGSLGRLHRMTRGMTSVDIDGVDVLLSHDLGPAALGFGQRKVIVPHWIVALPVGERRTILLHEQEHAAARDPMLLLLGVLAVALQPWNVPLWMLVARLRFALEADCDARVLRRSRCGARRYGALLLQVHQQEFLNRVRGRFAVTAFVDSTSHLERRVRRMTDRQPRLRFLATAAAFATLVLCVGTALTMRVSNTRAAEPTAPHASGRAPARSSSSTPVGLASESDSTRAAGPGTPSTVASLVRSALPALVNTERQPSHSIEWSGVKGTVAIWPARAEPGADVVPETVLVRPSNSMWALKARIIASDSAGMSRVLVTDTLGRALPDADTLVVNGPVMLVLPDARFRLRIVSLSGDMMLTTSAIQAPDPQRGRWVSTLLGRDFRASRSSAGESTRFIAVGPATGKSQRVP